MQQKFQKLRLRRRGSHRTARRPLLRPSNSHDESEFDCSSYASQPQSTGSDQTQHLLSSTWDENWLEIFFGALMLLDLNFSKGSFHISSVSHVSLSNTFIHMIAMLVKISFAIGDTRLPVSHNKSCQITSQISFFSNKFQVYHLLYYYLRKWLCTRIIRF